MQYDEAMNYLQELTKFGFNFGLGRVEELLRRLGDPQRRLRVIHTGGTNGKGSVTAMVAAMLEKAGYTAGTFTSPHLHSYTERYRINGVAIGRERVAELITQLRPHLEAMVAEGFEQPTEFEVSTAAAFLYFWEEKVDFLVLEVGLGGAIDSTNVVEKPLVTVITNVAMDHMDYLGHTIREIAGVKAGIAKAGVPMVTAAQGEAWHVIRQACREKGAPLVRVLEAHEGVADYAAPPDETIFPDGGPAPSGGSTNAPACSMLSTGGPDSAAVRPAPPDAGEIDGRASADGDERPSGNAAGSPPPRVVTWRQGEGGFDLRGQYLSLDGLTGQHRELYIPLLGRHQLANAATAVAVVELLREQGWPVSEQAIASGLAATRWPARLEIVREEPLVLIDGAHNYDGARSLRRALDDYFPGRGVVLVLGMLGDKERARVVSELAPRARAVVVTRPNNPRAGDWQRLAGEARRYVHEVYTVEEIPAAVRQGMALVRPGEVVCITGSLYMVAEAREQFTTLT
ncbi:bifunctional folylpolyglutamate synthase/dihydrofolate synthase [Desulfotomaculum copahuensis]|uniref:bifunctional folylpolyglutamate synthase/dihydrofolate synthase n=1 Tax=Desulfotomaculum copahuensis TaxID=1838280 RepID=UPI000B1DEFD2|nr:folylpolyglutamate synthase/dihydrofolate synthase family protein [Desulfotomaculum copahuensis]